MSDTENLLSVDSPEFKAWLQACQESINKHFADDLPNCFIPTLTAEVGSKSIKIVSNGVSQRMVYAFIARMDYTTKELGTVKRGDIQKPESFKKPAKISRGNLFDQHKGLGRLASWGMLWDLSINVPVAR